MIHWIISVGGLYLLFAIQYVAELFGISKEIINSIFF